MNKISFKKNLKYFTLTYKYEFLTVFIFYIVFKWLDNLIYIAVLLVLLLLLNRVYLLLAKKRIWSNHFFYKYFFKEFKDFPFIIMGIYILISKLLLYIFKLLVNKIIT